MSRRPFALLWAGSSGANLGDGILRAAAPLLAATLTRDPALVSGIVVAWFLPWVLFGVFAGVLVDRTDRRALLVAGNGLRVLALAGLAFALATGTASLVLLYIVVLLLGTAETVVDTSSLAILPQLVPGDRIDTANGRLFTTQATFDELAGPPLGSFVFALSAVGAFVTGSAAYLLAAVLFALLPRARPVGDDLPRERLRTALAEGFRWFRGSRMLQVCATVAATYNFTHFATFGVLVLLAQDRLGLDAVGYGLLLASAALGGIPGGLLAPVITRKLGPGRAMLISNLLPGLGFLALALTTSAIVAAVGILVSSFCSTLGNVVQIGLRQRIVPNALLGRVTSFYRLIGLGAIPLGGLAGGLLAGAFGLTAPYWVGGVLMIVMAVAVAPYLTNARIRNLPSGDPTP